MGKASVTMRFDAETAKAVQGFVTLENKADALKRKSEALAQSSARGANNSAQGHEKWGKSIAGVAAQYIGVAAAIGLATKALASMREESKRAAATAHETASPMAQLAQVAGGDAKKFAALQARARAMAKTEGMDLSAAAATVFTVESNGFKPGADRLFGGLFGPVQNPAEIAEGVSTMRSAMGADETGTPRQVLNKMLYAAATSKTTLEQFAPAASMSAKMVRGAGASDEEYFAALAIGSRGAKSADVAATQLGAFASTTSKLGMKEQGLMARARAIQAKGMDEAQLIKYFGRKEAVTGYQTLLDNAGEIQSVQDALYKTAAEPEGKDLYARTVGLYHSDPLLGAEREARRAEQGLKQAEVDKLAVPELQRDAAEARAQKYLLEHGASGADRWVASGINTAARFVGVDQIFNDPGDFDAGAGSGAGQIYRNEREAQIDYLNQRPVEDVRIQPPANMRDPIPVEIRGDQSTNLHAGRNEDSE